MSQQADLAINVLEKFDVEDITIARRMFNLLVDLHYLADEQGIDWQEMIQRVERTCGQHGRLIIRLPKENKVV